MLCVSCFNRRHIKEKDPAERILNLMRIPDKPTHVKQLHHHQTLTFSQLQLEHSVKRVVHKFGVSSNRNESHKLHPRLQNVSVYVKSQVDV